MKGRALTIKLAGTTGVDSFIEMISKKWLIRRIAKRLMRGMWQSADPNATDLLIQTPWGTWRVVDKNGRIEPARPDAQSQVLP